LYPGGMAKTSVRDVQTYQSANHSRWTDRCGSPALSGENRRANQTTETQVKCSLGELIKQQKPR